DLEADHRFPGHQRTSAAASTADSRAAAALSILASAKFGAMSWAPSGKPSDRPTGKLTAGRPARLTGQTKMSARYIATGSSVFSPALKAGVGVVGVSRRSTPLAKVRRKSSAISDRTRWAFR